MVHGLYKGADRGVCASTVCGAVRHRVMFEQIHTVPYGVLHVPREAVPLRDGRVGPSCPALSAGGGGGLDSEMLLRVQYCTLQNCTRTS